MPWRTVAEPGPGRAAVGSPFQRVGYAQSLSRGTHFQAGFRVRPGSSAGTSDRLKSGRSAVRSRPWPLTEALEHGGPAFLKPLFSRSFSAWSQFWSQLSFRYIPIYCPLRAAKLGTTMNARPRTSTTTSARPSSDRPEACTRMFLHPLEVSRLPYSEQDNLDAATRSGNQPGSDRLRRPNRYSLDLSRSHLNPLAVRSVS